jgi:uncharacterized protein YkwD
MKILTIILVISSTIVSHGQNNQSFYNELNDIRSKHLLKPLAVDTVLEKESKQWLLATSKHRSLIHGKSTPRNGEKYRAEVLANCPSSLECWMESPAHRKIILSRKARKIGYAWMNGKACARLTD